MSSTTSSRRRRSRRTGEMSETSLSSFLSLAEGRRGHFLLESGHHGGLWLDLDGLFTSARRIAAFVNALSARLREHDVEMICGPLLGGAFLAQLVAKELDLPFCFTERQLPAGSAGMYSAQYVLPTAFRSQVNGRRLAIVDDVVSAGSSLRATRAELESHGARVIVAGALLQLGDVGTGTLQREGVPMEALLRDDYALWEPSSCPLCASAVPLTSPATATA